MLVSGDQHTSRKKRQNMYWNSMQHKSIITQLETDLKSNIQIKIFAIILGLLLQVTIFNPVFAQENQTYPEYVIQSGDTLIGIASLFNVSVGEITELNNIEDSNQIFPGLHIKIPGYAGISGMIAPVTVDLGESWRELLIRYNANEEIVKKINHVLLASELYAGTKLLIPVSQDLENRPLISEFDSKSTLLEISALTNSNPTSLLLTNQQNAPFNFYAGDFIFSPMAQGQEGITVSTLYDSVSVAPLPLVQGTTAVIKINSNQPSEYTGTLNGEPLHFHSEDGIHFYSLQGIHAMSEPGLIQLEVKKSENQNETIIVQQQIILEAGFFETDPPLTVDPGLIDPVTTKPELDTIHNLISDFTPQKFWQGSFLSPDHDYATEIPNYEQVKEITSFFGSRRTYNDDPTITFHTGIDFGGGKTLPIVAAADGKVVFAGFMDVRGNATIIDHGLGVFTAYYHQSEINVEVGDIISKGQRIGKVGNTGRVDRADEYDGAGAHLHWELWVNGVQVNPLDWVNQEYP